MGIVPWVSKSVDTPEVQLAAPVTNLDVVETVSVEKAPLTPVPYSLEELKFWLPQQPVRTMLGRSGPQSFSGVEDAPLLVVVEGADSNTDTEPMRSPFNAESAQLFELMMRAIVMPVAKRKQCVLHSVASYAQPATGIAESVSQQLHVQTRAVLLLVKRWDSAETVAAENHHVRLDHPAIPLWRIPHPDVLIQRNELKRQAWLSLQALQSAL